MVSKETKKAWLSGKKKLLLLAVLLVIPAMVAVAAVFIYYPMNVNIQQQSPPVQFATGSNSGQADLEGQTITTSIGANKTSVTLSLHPTYQRSYYQDILHITNGGTQKYQVYIRVDTPMTLPSGGYAKMYIINGTNKYTIDLTTTGTTTIGTIPSGNTWQVDVEIYIPEGNTLTTTSASVSLIYTPETGETPP